MSFPDPHQFRTLQPGETARIYYLRVPDDMVGFMSHIGNNSWDNSNIDIKIDGESLEGSPIQREIGAISSPTVFNPPFVVNRKIEVFGTNNDTDAHTFEVVIQGYFLPRSYFVLGEDD